MKREGREGGTIFVGECMFIFVNIMSFYEFFFVYYTINIYFILY